MGYEIEGDFVSDSHSGSSQAHFLRLAVDFRNLGGVDPSGREARGNERRGEQQAKLQG